MLREAKPDEASMFREAKPDEAPMFREAKPDEAPASWDRTRRNNCFLGPNSLRPVVEARQMPKWIFVKEHKYRLWCAHPPQS